MEYSIDLRITASEIDISELSKLWSLQAYRTDIENAKTISWYFDGRNAGEDMLIWKNPNEAFDFMMMQLAPYTQILQMLAEKYQITLCIGCFSDFFCTNCKIKLKYMKWLSELGIDLDIVGYISDNG